MSATPNFASAPKIGMGQVLTANAARDGTGTIATIFTAGASGSLIKRVAITATGATTAGVIRLFLHDGTNARLIEEVPVQANTPNKDMEVWQAFVDYSMADFAMQTGWSLRASTEVAEVFNVCVYGADF